MTPNNLRNLMDANALNVKKTSAMLGVTGRAVYHWLNGTRPIPKMAWGYLQLKVQSKQTIQLRGDQWEVK